MTVKLAKIRKKIDQISINILPILKANGVTRSSLFGSFVTGEDRRDSDVDILVDLTDEKTLLDLVGLKIKLEKKLRKKVDLITFASLSPALKKIILDQQFPIL